MQIQYLQDKSTVIQVPAEVLFNISSFTIKRSGKKALMLLAELLNAYPDRLISVEGHSDAVPVGRRVAVPSNWELPLHALRLQSASCSTTQRWIQHGWWSRDTALAPPDRQQ